MQLIDGKKIAERIKDEVVQEIANLKGARPNLAIVLVGERDDSKLYVRLKEKQAKEVGIDTHLYQCDADVSEAELISMIDFLNADETIDGILVQLPLPEGLDADKVIERILPDKDVDGFHPYNLNQFLLNCNNPNIPPIVAVILEINKEINFDLKGKSAVAIVNSELFGQAIKHALECGGTLCTILHQDDDELAAKSSKADLLISAIGHPGLITKEFVKPGAVIIDIGINRLPDGRVAGDVDLESVKDVTGFLTPVPGGVGPMTIAMALKNTLRLFKEKINK
ncbi:MAG: bifunctional 5,10-methylenetetrahydrofolate dehydrogenase/5,10-methenyltetrahydrofolate cyclohydrolase [Bacteroidales bacterium]|nr:bifunctional 5,10-methylenetetrahydrofolate dehydrogenase/5,10-methenyltetrahydrofolate cyclohydrolase [Bacteroidales bacterium]